MRGSMSDIFELIEGLEPVDPKAIEAFRAEMEQRVIPEIVETLHRRQRDAAESRHWIIT